MQKDRHKHCILDGSHFKFSIHLPVSLQEKIINKCMDNKEHDTGTSLKFGW